MLSAWSASFLAAMTRISREMNHRAFRERRRAFYRRCGCGCCRVTLFAIPGLPSPTGPLPYCRPLANKLIFLEATAPGRAPAACDPACTELRNRCAEPRDLISPTELHTL